MSLWVMMSVWAPGSLEVTELGQIVLVFTSSYHCRGRTWCLPAFMSRGSGSMGRTLCRVLGSCRSLSASLPRPLSFPKPSMVAPPQAHNCPQGFMGPHCPYALLVLCCAGPNLDSSVQRTRGRCREGRSWATCTKKQC